ncbi:excinuclease ABC subunit UvrC, partial [uncultured Phenylobacterium sp.]|uniref:excinuclease ABC subunit UvrC n=1 Tax=uncultured Phenylobacterium sp. TaxID=349273 RepID=UPI0025D8D235
INMLERAFLLRSCSDSMFESRTRPCLLFQIKRCSGPCTGEIEPDRYRGLVDEAVRFLRGESQNVRQMYQTLMQDAAERLDYESAATYRNRLWALAHVTADQSINPEGIEEADVFAAYQDAGQTCIQVFFFRTGQNWGNRAYYPRADRSLPAEEVLDSFIAQFYDDKPVPRLVLVSHDLPHRDLLSEALSTKADRKVEIRTPQRGVKMGVVEHALQNAREALARRLAESSSQRILLDGLKERFDLPRVPRRIEVYDNSHIMGTNAVGAMIVAGPDGFQKSQYRKFNIKSTDITPGDDFGMMKEVLRRRFSRLVKEEEEGEGAVRPDLVLLDGGAGQLSVVREIMADLGVDDIPVVGVAKGPDRDAGLERFFLPGKPPFMLEPKSPVLYYLQRLRDEAHRFAIGTHRVRRAIDMKKNPLDEIEGVGPGRKRALLHAFGSARGVSRASVEDLAKVEGVSEALAERVHAYFRKG